jgi:hypothetical protein
VKIELTKVIQNHKNEPLRTGPREDSPEATVRDALSMALLQNGENMTSTQKLTDYRLLNKLQESDPDFTVEELARLNDVAGRNLPLVSYGFVYPFLNQK